MRVPGVAYIPGLKKAATYCPAKPLENTLYPYGT